MDYIEVFKNLRTNNKYGRKSPHKAVLMLTVIELYEKNILTDNEIRYDETLKSTFMKVWNKVLPNDPIFHSEAYLPFWYLQGDSFWHIVPVKGKEDVLSLMRDNNIKPSEAKLYDSVKYVELDEDLYFLMTIQSGRASLKKSLLETYTELSKKQIDKMATSTDNAIDYSVSALSEYKKISSHVKGKDNRGSSGMNNRITQQFQQLDEDLQIVLNIQYYSFLRTHRNERGMFKEICPSVYNLLDIIVNHTITQEDILPSFAIIYDNFLSDLKIALMCEENSIDLIEKIEKAIDIIRGNKEEDISPVEKNDSWQIPDENTQKETDNTDVSYEKYGKRVEHYDSRINRTKTTFSSTEEKSQKDIPTSNRSGKPWTENEEKLLAHYFKETSDFQSLAKIFGRSEVAIKTRLGKLGLIDYTYGQDEEKKSEKENTVLRVTFKNGNQISYENSTQVFLEVIKRISPQWVYSLGVLYKDLPLIIDYYDDKYPQKLIPLGKGLFLVIPNTIQEKKLLLENISTKLDLDLNIEQIDIKIWQIINK